jgi:hypothetical protein
MSRLKEMTKGSSVKDVLPDGSVTLVDVNWNGAFAVELTYKDALDRLGNGLLCREREPTLEVVTTGLPWSFDRYGHLFRLVSEVDWGGLANLFDPLLAVHASMVATLPHHITAVYEEIAFSATAAYLLADDPDAGKTIMCGLRTKELNVHGDLQRCMIVRPRNLVGPWLDEMDRSSLSVLPRTGLGSKEQAISVGTLNSGRQTQGWSNDINQA